jgi:hypothetical protein
VGHLLGQVLEIRGVVLDHLDVTGRAGLAQQLDGGLGDSVVDAVEFHAAVKRGGWGRNAVP